MTELVDRFRTYLDGSRARHIEELRRLVGIPSISAQGTGIDECASAVVELLEGRGLRATTHPTPGSPIIIATGGADPGNGTKSLLFYEHYDVQPPEPLDEWTTPPFELTERNGNLYGRGSSDTKGNLICRLAAIDAVREVLGTDKLHYRFVIEGEEEVGSPNLPAFLKEHADELRSDACIWESGGVEASDLPEIYIGMKGIQTLELRCKTANEDLHSMYGAVADNPLYRLAAAIASMRDAGGNVLIDGFYDDVDPLTAADEEALRAQPSDSEGLASTYGVRRFVGPTKGRDFHHRLQLLPCLNVNGIHGGYGGPGSKTVLPREGMAKLDFRLVPSQRPERVLELLRIHLDKHGFSDIEIIDLHGEPAGRTPLEDPFVHLVVRTAELAYGKRAVVRPSHAGSGPVHAFREYLGVPFASAGVNYPGNRYHAPDEHLRIVDFDRGRLHTSLVLAALAGDV